MSSRTLALATVMLLIGCCAVQRAGAQAQNLEAGKTPSQIFSQTCSACHKTPRGLLRTVPAGSLSGFLRQHYTTSPNMAGILASYLMSNGASDGRYAQPKAGREGAKDVARAPSESGLAPGADGRQLSARHPLSKRARPAAEEPKTGAPKEAPSADNPAADEKASAEPGKMDTGSDAGNQSGNPASSDINSQREKNEDARPERTRRSSEGGNEAAKPEREAATPRADQVPSTSTAPGSAAGPPASSDPAVTASVPPAPSVTPAGPPTAPISK